VDFNLSNLPGAGLEDLAEAARCCSECGAMLIAEPGPEADAVAAAQFAQALLAAAGEAARNIAFYYPRVHAAGTTTGPGGAVAGLIARVDAAQGVWGAPAGTSYPLAGVDGLAQDLDGGELEDLSNQGVNCLRSFAGVGTVVWGARTLAGGSNSGSEWKYVPVRRLALFIEESLERGLQWTVSEPMGERLWKLVRQAAEEFLHCLWREGAFPGSRAQDAYFVRCDSSTMTQDDVDRGRLVVHVGIAPLRPAEFVVIRVGRFRRAG
jgi:phage tail sheath protein FI